MFQQAIIKRLEELATLTVERGKVRAVTVSRDYGEVFRLVAQLPTVTEINIYGRQGRFMSDDDLRHLKAHPGIRELCFFHVKGLSDEGSDVFPTLPALEDLHLGGPKSFGDRALEHVSHCSSLTSLTISPLKVSEIGLNHLHRLQELKELSLPDFTEPSQFATSLQFPKLEKLSIQGSGVEDVVAAAISRMATLRELSLVDSSVTDEGFKGIAALEHLGHLLLSGNQCMTPSSVRLLASMSSLEHLTWSKMPLDASAVDALAKMKGLKFLNINDTNVSKAQTAALIQALPDCAIFTDFAGEE